MVHRQLGGRGSQRVQRVLLPGPQRRSASLRPGQDRDRLCQPGCLALSGFAAGHCRSGRVLRPRCRWTSHPWDLVGTVAGSGHGRRRHQGPGTHPSHGAD